MKVFSYFCKTMILRLRLITIFLFCFVVYSCQSAKTIIDVKNLDSRLISSFSTCSSDGGTDDIQVYKKEKLYGSFDVEWLVKRGSWKTVVMSSIGQDLMSVDYDKNQNRILVSQVQSFPYNIKVGEDGFIYLNQRMIPLKVSEIPCILNHHYPKSWLKSALVYKQNDSYYIEKNEPKRTLQLEMLLKKETVKKKEGTKEVKKVDKLYACASISWDAFLWFDAELKICTEDNRSTVVDIKDYLVKLTAID